MGPMQNFLGAKLFAYANYFIVAVMADCTNAATIDFSIQDKAQWIFSPIFVSLKNIQR